MEWMCAECGRPHPKNSPPCKNCGAMQFEKTTVQIDSDEEEASTTGWTERVRPRKASTTGQGPSSIEWQCTECGRTQPKNSPPCSRCGNMHLEAVEVGETYDEEPTSGVSLLGVAKYAVAIVAVVLLVLALANAGLLTDSPAPTVENVPGDANRSSGLDLTVVESHVAERINEERASEGVGTLSLEPETSNIARYYNQLMVKRSEYPLDRSSDDVREEFRSCSNPANVYNQLGFESSDRRAIESYRSEAELSKAITIGWFTDADLRAIVLGDGSSLGVDVHVAPDGTVYATVSVC